MRHLKDFFTRLRLPEEAAVLLSMAGLWVGILIAAWIGRWVFKKLFPEKEEES